MPGYMNGIPGRGGRLFGGRGSFGRGGGRGFCNRYFATGLTGWQRAWMGGEYAPPAPFAPPVMSSEQELAFLRDQLKYMEEGMQRARERIAELEKGDTAQ
jgi:hypothetical protein